MPGRYLRWAGTPLRLHITPIKVPLTPELLALCQVKRGSAGQTCTNKTLDNHRLFPWKTKFCSQEFSITAVYLCVCGIAEKSCQTGWVTLEWSWASITLRLCKKGIIKREAASKGGKGVNVRVWGVGGVEWGKRGSDLNHHTGAKKGIGWPGKVSSWQGWSLRDDASKEHCASLSHSLDVYDQSGKERVDADGITRALQAGRVMEEKTELLTGSYK